MKDAEMRQVVGLDKTSFLQLGLWATQAYIELCTVDDEKMKIICKNVYSSQILARNPILLAGKQRKSGQVVFAWTAQGNQLEAITYDDGAIGRSYIKVGYDYDYSSIVIAEDKIYCVLKQYGMISIYNDLANPPTQITLDAKSF